MYTFCKKYGNRIFIREHDQPDSSIVTKHKWNLYYQDSKDGVYESVYGLRLSKKTFPTVRTAEDYKKDNEHSMTLYGAKNFGYQYIRDKFIRKDPIVPKDLYVANIDIETGRDKDGYSSSEEARCAVTSITLHDMFRDVYTVWGYKSEGYKPKNKNVRYVNCRDEMDMLRKFCVFISCRHPDIITGWNVEQYDITYIINRINLLFSDGDEIVSSLSPFSIVNEKESHDSFGNTHQIYDIVGISILDYLILFKKFTYKTPENYKLDTVAHMILGERKIDYSEYANLQDLYNQDYELFIDYNIKDVEIVTRLDQKLKLFDLVLSVAYKAGINYSDVVSPVTTWDVLIYNAVMDQGIVPSCKMPNSETGQYVGGYVKEPVPGMYNWIVSCDLNSLYPHLQMGINISPEKRVPESKLPDELKDLRESLKGTISGIQNLLDENIDTSILRKYDVSLAPNGQFYRRDADGFIPVILEGMYNERKAVKRSMLDDKQKMEDGSDNDLSDQISQKNTLQMALKILMNSEYGAMANSYFRYFDLRNAEAVTSSGQLAIMWVAKHLNIFLNSMIETKDVDYIIAIDTDSVYLNLEHLVEKGVPDGTSINDTVEILSRWSAEVLEPKIAKIYGDLAEYVNAHKQKMVMTREVIANKGFWTGKKRYALNVYDDEGVRYTTPDTKIMGLECVRSSVPEFCRNNIKETIIKILEKNESDVQDFIIDVKKDFYEQTPEDISFPRGTNNIEKWRERVIKTESYFCGYGEPREYIDFVKKGTPIHVRGCIIYNKYLDDHGFTDERIQSGDKIKFCHLKQPNTFQSHVIAYPPAMNTDVHKELKDSIDYEQQWIGTFYKPISAMMECVGWSAKKINKIECTGDFY